MFGDFDVFEKYNSFTFYFRVELLKMDGIVLNALRT